MYVNLFNYEFSLYTLQQLVIRSLFTSFYSNNFLFLFFVFLSGLITACSPCLLSMIPVTFSYMGMNGNKNKNILSFLSGLVSTLLLLLLAFSVLGNRYYYIFISLPLIACSALIILGLFFLNILYVQLDMNILSQAFLNEWGLLVTDFLTGCFLAVSVAPCSAPILIVLVTILSFSSNSILMFFYILIYLLGYILPLLILARLILYFRDKVNYLLISISKSTTSWSGFVILLWGLLKLLEFLFL